MQIESIYTEKVGSNSKKLPVRIIAEGLGLFTVMVKHSRKISEQYVTSATIISWAPLQFIVHHSTTRCYTELL